MSYKKQEMLTLREHRCFVGSVLFIFFLAFCVVLLCVFMCSVLWCLLRFPHYKLCSVRLYLQLFAGRIMSYLHYLCLVVSNTYCVVFLFCLCSSCVISMSPVSLDYPLLIAPTVFSNLYIDHIKI